MICAFTADHLFYDICIQTENYNYKRQSRVIFVEIGFIQP